MSMRRWCLSLLLLLAVSIAAAGQQKGDDVAQPQDIPEANPGRPTVSTPATLTPVGYFQFETGILGAWTSPGLSSQQDISEVIKFSVSSWLELLASTAPYVHTIGSTPENGSGDVDLGAQVVLHHGEGLNPTLALGYFGRVYNGGTPDLDVGSFRNSALFLVSMDVRGFHIDSNYLFNEQVDGAVRRAQFGQTLSVSHPLGEKFGVGGELWHFTQPFLQSNTVATLWYVSYSPRKNLVFDAGFNRGLTSTSTRWETFGGFTYLLPHKVPLPWH